MVSEVRFGGSLDLLIINRHGKWSLPPSQYAFHSKEGERWFRQKARSVKLLLAPGAVFLVGWGHKEFILKRFRFCNLKVEQNMKRHFGAAVTRIIHNAVVSQMYKACNVTEMSIRDMMGHSS